MRNLVNELAIVVLTIMVAFIILAWVSPVGNKIEGAMNKIVDNYLGENQTVENETETTTKSYADNIKDKYEGETDWLNVANSDNVKYKVIKGEGKVLEVKRENDYIYVPMTNIAGPLRDILFNGSSLEPQDGAYVKLYDGIMGADGYYQLKFNDYYGTEDIEIIFKKVSDETTTVPPTTIGSEYPQWNKDTTYTGGNRVIYNGKVYQAKWRTLGENPETSGNFGVWKLIGEAN